MGRGNVANGALPLEVLDPADRTADVGGGLVLRGAGDWCSGGPLWLQAAGVLTSRVTLDVDLMLGQLSVSVGDSSGAAMRTVSIPALVENEASGWRPFVSLTAVGQQARILDVHVKSVV